MLHEFPTPVNLTLPTDNNNVELLAKLLHTCKLENAIHKVQGILSKVPSLVNSASSHDLSTPLHIAVYAEQLPVISYLIQQNANIEAIDVEGNTPLHIAAMVGSSTIVKYLLHKNASINSVNQVDNIFSFLLDKIIIFLFQ